MSEREKMLAAVDEAERQCGEAYRQWEETVRERDSLREQLESVACRAATAETALETAQAASGNGGRTPPGWDAIRALIDAAEAVRDWAGRPLVRNEDRYCSTMDDLRVAIDAAAALDVRMRWHFAWGLDYPVNPQPSPCWLTQDERQAISFLTSGRSQFTPQTPHEARRNAAIDVCDALLGRSTPAKEPTP